MRIGIFGGTFNPPHIGHLILAEQARQELALDRVLFVPAFISPFKRADTMLDANLRLEMVELAISDHDRFSSEPFEIQQSSVSYTIDSVKHLKSRHIGDAFTLLMGADTFSEFHKWKNPDELCSLVSIGVAMRPGHTLTPDVHAFGSIAQPFVMPLIDVSSHDIRERVRAGKSIHYLVPWTVKTFIESQRLYR